MANQANFRVISPREEQKVQDIRKLFSELVTYRNVFAAQWEEAASLVDPDSRNTFMYGSYNFPGQKKTQYQVDSSGALAVQQFCAIADSMITPQNRLWHGLETDSYLMKQRGVREFYQQLTKVVFNYRYRSDGNFQGQNYRIWKSLGCYGNLVMFVDALDRRWHGGRPGLRYKAVPLGECFFAENHQGVVNTLIRWFRLTDAHAAEKFYGDEYLPSQLQTALEKDLQTPFQFLHCVKPRDDDDYDPQRLDERGLPYESWYVSIEGQLPDALRFHRADGNRLQGIPLRRQPLRSDARRSLRPRAHAGGGARPQDIECPESDVSQAGSPCRGSSSGLVRMMVWSTSTSAARRLQSRWCFAGWQAADSCSAHQRQYRDQ